MITLEQLEADVEELTLEISRRMAEVRGMFAQVADLRSQADLFRKIIALRSKAEPQSEETSFICLRHTTSQNEVGVPICAMSWAGSSEHPSDPQLYVRRDWKTLLSPDLQPYFTELLIDWSHQVRADPAKLIATIREVSVGPIIAMSETTHQKSRFRIALQELLGDCSPDPEVRADL